MGTTWAGCLSVASVVFLTMIGASRGDEPSRTRPAAIVASDRASKSAPGAETDATSVTAGTAGGDAASVRAATVERLKRLATRSEKEKDAPTATSATRGLRGVLEERLRWLDDWDKVVKARHDVEHPEVSPERQAAEIKADLGRVKAQLDRAARDPATLLPGAFRNPEGPVTDLARAEMNEALDAARGELREWRARFEALRAENAKAGTTASPLRVERDRIHRRVAALKSRGDEHEATDAPAKTPEEAELARERRVNFLWELKVEAERLHVQEAKIASEGTRGAIASLSLQAHEAHVQLATRALERLQEQSRRISDLHEKDLKREAADHQKRAARVDDPLEKYRAGRTADLLELQAQVHRYEDELATSPYPSLDEQQILADRAADEFAAARRMLNDKRVSHLDALRLNNDFRRIGPERERIEGRDLAAASARLTQYENALSGVETDLINDSRDDLLQHQNLLERLPKERQGEVTAAFRAIEARHTALLERKRAALEKLAMRAEQTQLQVVRRLKTLDDQYGFIRTHIFWVRDQEPIAPATLARCRREVANLGRSLWPLVREASNRSRWGRVSAEFALATLALIGLPLPLYKLRKSLCPRRLFVR